MSVDRSPETARVRLVQAAGEYYCVFDAGRRQAKTIRNELGAAINAAKKARPPLLPGEIEEILDDAKATGEKFLLERNNYVGRRLPHLNQ